MENIDTDKILDFIERNNLISIETNAKRYYDLFDKMSYDNKKYLIEKIYTKYNSSRYYEKEINCGRMPKYPFYELMFKYARINGKPIKTKNSYTEKYKVENLYIIEATLGKESIYTVEII